MHDGEKPAELAKGKNAVKLGNMDVPAAALGAVKDALKAGERIAQIEQAHRALHVGLAKRK